jgi:mRNA interferase HicA
VQAAEFVRKVKRLGQARGIPVRFVAHRGKGSHGTLYYGSARAIVQDLKRELPTGTFHAMVKQLGLAIEDLR